MKLRMTRRAAAWTFTLLVIPLCAQESPLAKGFDHFYNLEYDQGIAEFEKAALLDPKAAGPHNHIAQTLLYREMFRSGALESELVSGTNPFLRRPKMNPGPQVEARFFDDIRKAMDLSQQRLDRNPNDTSALYALGVAYGLRANYNFLVRKAWRDALRDATTGRKLHNRVTELDPANYDARLMQGVHDYVVGSLPLGWKILGFLVGFRGDKDKGIQTLEEVGRKGAINRMDAQVLLCALYRREKRPRQAVELLEGLIQRFPRNYLLRFELGQMYSDLGDKNKALAAVEAVAALKRKGAPGVADLRWEKIYYRLGTIQFWYNDLDLALDNMRKVTAVSNDLDLNTGVTAWLRLGQIYDLKNQRQEAIQAYRHVIAQAPEADAARESRAYISSPYRRAKA